MSIRFIYVIMSQLNYKSIASAWAFSFSFASATDWHRS